MNISAHFKREVRFSAKRYTEILLPPSINRPASILVNLANKNVAQLHVKYY